MAKGARTQSACDLDTFITRIERNLFVWTAAVALGLGCLNAPDAAHAQTTYTWDAVGVSQSIGDGGNWVGGTAPSFVNAGNSSDSAIFSASSNTTIVLRDVASGDNFNQITFDASAPAYTFKSSPGNIVNDMDAYGSTGGFFNNSSHTQDFTAALPDIYINGGTLAATNGDPLTHLSFDLFQNYFAGGKMTGDFDVRTQTINATRTTDSFTKSVGLGTLFITGDSGTNNGILVIGSSTLSGPFGAVRISNNNALGGGGTTANNYTQILGGSNNDGRLELVNNITSNEGIRLAARQLSNYLNPAILNVSDNNTLSGPFLMASGGAVYDFAATSGTLNVTSNINWNLSGDRYLLFQGAGNAVFSGNLSNTNASAGGVAIEQLGPGTLTLTGTTNTNMVNWIVQGGTLAIGANATFSFNAVSGDLLAADGITHLAPQVFVQNGATLDVSAVSGGFNLTQTLQGTGNVVGNLHMASGTQIVPGGSPIISVHGTAVGITSGVGSLHFHNGLDMSAGSQMVWHLGALSTANPGTDFSQMTVDGNLALAGTSSLAIDLSLLPDQTTMLPGQGDPFWNVSHTWTIINSPINPGNTNFASLVGGSVATGTFSTSYSAGVPGDVDHNGVVNGLDIGVIAGHWLTTGAPGIPGDADNNGVVNGLDIGVIAGNWLHTGGLGAVLLTYTPSGPGAAVPEPSTFLLAALGLVGLVFVRRQRR